MEALTDILLHDRSTDAQGFLSISRDIDADDPRSVLLIGFVLSSFCSQESYISGVRLRLFLLLMLIT